MVLHYAWQYQHSIYHGNYNSTETTQFRSIYFHVVKMVYLFTESDTVETDNTSFLWRNTRSIFESWNFQITIWKWFVRILVRQMYFCHFRYAWTVVSIYIYVYTSLMHFINRICNFPINRNTKILNFRHTQSLSELPYWKSYDELTNLYLAACIHSKMVWHVLKLKRPIGCNSL